MTTRINIILTHSLSTDKNAIKIIISANKFNVIFCFLVILLFLTKSSKYFLYILVPLNHISNFREPFIKQKEANSNNGVVGTTGKTIPKSPKPRLTKPAMINNTFTNLLILPPSILLVLIPL